jgi:hypothetical protein
MKIQSADISLSALHQSMQRREQQLTARAWRDDAPLATPQQAANDTVSLSEAGKAAAAADSEAEVNESPKLRLLRLVIEAMFGEEVRLTDLSGLDPQADKSNARSNVRSAAPAAARGMSIDYHEQKIETEQLQVHASGTVRTADGREIRFEMALQMDRRYVEETHLSVRTGAAAQPKDPIALNFDGGGVQLSGERINFDLNADGQTEAMPFVRAGSGFLVFDRNANGRVDNGSELFGPRSGDGFNEMSALDADRNGWLDEADPMFSALKIWTDAARPDQLQSLAQAKVGAISLHALETPFEYRDAANQSLGAVRATGVYLQESGAAGAVQQVDLTV